MVDVILAILWINSGSLGVTFSFANYVIQTCMKWHDLWVYVKDLLIFVVIEFMNICFKPAAICRQVELKKTKNNIGTQNCSIMTHSMNLD